MLKSIIEEIIAKIEPVNTNSEHLISEIKDMAKSIFFAGNIMALKDYIFDLPNEKSAVIDEKFYEKLNGCIDNPIEFIQLFKQIIQTKFENENIEKNLDNLLEVLDYGYLKDMLKMFTL